MLETVTMPDSMGVQAMSDVAEAVLADLGHVREQTIPIIWYGVSEPIIVDSSESELHPERVALRRLARYHLRQIDCPFPPEE